MASEYFLKLAREQAPPEPPRELTKAEQRKNWWHYHWWYFAAGAVLLCIVGSMLWNILGIGQVRPDYIFAYVGRDPLDEALAEQLERSLAALGEDVNGDGTVRVELRQYASNRSGDPGSAMYYNYAADTQLLADVTAGESYFFLVEDPKSFQRSYELLADADGSPPAEGDREVSDKVFAWNACPVLSGLEANPSALSGLYLGRRCFYGDEALGHEAEEAFWQLITKGARR